MGRGGLWESRWTKTSWRSRVTEGLSFRKVVFFNQNSLGVETRKGRVREEADFTRKEGRFSGDRIRESYEKQKTGSAESNVSVFKKKKFFSLEGVSFLMGEEGGGAIADVGYLLFPGGGHYRDETRRYSLAYAGRGARRLGL